MKDRKMPFVGIARDVPMLSLNELEQELRGS